MKQSEAMKIPTDRKYTETHEWFLVNGEIVTVGITQYAADELTDITYVELPEIGTEVGVGDTLGEVESVKATSELFSAVAGTVVEVNERLADHPELVNNQAFDEAWLVKIKAASTESLNSLMDAKAYEATIHSAD